MTVIVAGASVASITNPPLLSGVAVSIAFELLSRLGPQTPGAVAGAVGASASSGAIFGAVLGGSATGALTGAVSGGAGSALLSTGPIGWVVLGSSMDEDEQNITFDCWKKVLRDSSTEVSSGMLIRDVISDSRIKDVRISPRSEAMPEVVLENVWNEKFKVEFFVVEDKLMAHALPCC